MSPRIIADPAEFPAGFLYRPNFLSDAEEAELLRTIKALEFGTYDFRGYIAKRRVVVWGEGYGPGEQRMAITGTAIPEFLLPVRERAASVAGLRAEEIVQALVTEYSAGTAIGWHRDRPQFETVLGVSLGGAARFRLKPYEGEGKIISVMVEPRSIYVMSGVARWKFQHSIPAVKELRYSITFRTLREKKKERAA